MPSAKSLFAKISTVIVGIGVVFMCFSLAVKIYQRIQNEGPFRPKIEGKILAKQAQFNDSKMWSSIQWIIVIEEKNGQQGIVKVDEQTYQRAQIGQWLKKDGGKYLLENQEINNETMSPQ